MPIGSYSLVLLHGARVGNRSTRLIRLKRRSVDFLHLLKEHLPERLSGAMQQNPKILSTHTDLPTDLVLVPFVEKNPLQQKMILFWQTLEDVTDLFLHFPAGNRISDTRAWVGNVHDSFVARWGLFG